MLYLKSVQCLVSTLTPAVMMEETQQYCRGDNHLVTKGKQVVFDTVAVRQADENKKISRFRGILPQWLAATAESLLLLNLGMQLGFPSVLIPVLTGKDRNDTLYFDTEQASWYGSITYIFQPPGSLVSGALLQSVGSKKLMILINLPLFACWVMVYAASSHTMLYIESALVGLVAGLSEAPTIRYIGEIAHPSLRGTLVTFSQIFLLVGILLVYFLGSVTDWKNTALISAVLPIISIVCMSQIPETPIWLMSKGRREEALESLRWLRGWTSADNVKEEFDKLEIYAKKPKKTTTLHSYEQEVDTRDEGQMPQPKINGEGTRSGDTETENGDARTVAEPSGNLEALEVEEFYEKRTFAEKWHDLTRKEMLVPLGKCILLHSFSVFGGGLPPMRPYIVTIFEKLKLPVQANWSSVITNVIGLIGCSCCMLLVRRVGKKVLLMFSAGFCALCLVGLVIFLNQTTTDLKGNPSAASWCPLLLFCFLYLFYTLGLQPLPWIYVGELLPYRGRGIATGVVVSCFYILTFFGVKFFPALEEQVGLSAIFMFFAVFSVLGVFYTYFILPETEGKFLADIETENARKTKESSTQ